MMVQMREMFKVHERGAWIQQQKKMYDMFSALSGITMEMRNYGVQSVRSHG